MFEYSQNCGPVSVTALTGQPYPEVHSFCETMGWTEEEGICILSLMVVLRSFGHHIRYLKGESEKGYTLRKVLDIIHPDKKYLIGIEGHVVAWMANQLVDTGKCTGEEKVTEIIEVS